VEPELVEEATCVALGAGELLTSPELLTSAEPLARLLPVPYTLGVLALGLAVKLCRAVALASPEAPPEIEDNSEILGVGLGHPELLGEAV